jgi:geranylgeranyl pyrophosphate synthase
MLETIYQPIQNELSELEKSLNQIAQVAPAEVTELVRYVLANRGKRIRPALTLLAGNLYHGKPEELVTMATAVELLHTATLIHDDIVDHSSQRRGKATPHTLWGDHTAVLLGDYLFATSAHLIWSLGNEQVTGLSSKTLVAISTGELNEALSSFNLEQTREQYFQRIADKTASLFILAVESGAILSQAPEEVIESLQSYAYNLGMSFQLVDDILDFTGREETTGKPIGSDLSQGVITLPAMLFLARHPESKMRLKKLSQENEPKTTIIEMIKHPAIIEESYQIAQDFSSKARSSLEALPYRNSAYESLVHLTDYVIRRGDKGYFSP